MRIIVTGANGYIGSRLLPLLVKEGHEVIAFVRSQYRLHIPSDICDQVQIITGDLLQPETLSSIPNDIDIAYYLVHSMSQTHKDFEELEKRSVLNFLECVKKTAVKQIIYLSGLTQDNKLSPHLASRLAVENLIKNSTVPYTILRAGIIIGSGSASFEIIRDLVEKLPVMIAPRWLSKRTQPIAIFDVLYYLLHVINHCECLKRTFDIGGPDQLTYKQMLYQFAEVRGLKRYIISVPVLTPRLSSYWLYFVTTTNFTLARSLVDSLKNEAICKDNSINKIIPHQCLSYKNAVKRAFDKISQNAVVSSWKDALVLSSLNPNLTEYIEVPEYGCVSDKREIVTTTPMELMIEKLWSIGGINGWYYMNWAWILRGMIDKFFGGVGLRRGRTHLDRLERGDVLDFWRVITANRQTGHLLLYAEMKVPGEAWLEFTFKTKLGKNVLIQKATFRPKGVLGRLYWYALLPIHRLIFRGMAKAITNI